MVKSKPSMTSGQRDALQHVNEYISETKPKVDSVIDETKRILWNDYGAPDYVSATDKERIRAALDDYEPSITESYIAEIVYGDSNMNYGEVMGALWASLEGTEWRDADDFYLTWSALGRMTEERKRLIAGQLAMRM